LRQYVFIGSFMLLLVSLLLYFSRWEVKPIDRKPEKVDPVLDILLERYESHFKEHLQQSKVPGAALVIVKDTAIVYARGFGYRAEDSNRKVNENTVFRIGSLSKSFAAVLTAILVEEQKLGWNDKVIDYLPDFSLQSIAQTQRIRLWHLLSHTTGLPSHAYTILLDKGIDRNRINEEFSKVALIGKEGITFAYQNVAYALIEDVIQESTGATFESLLREKVFLPLRMYHSSSSYEAIMNQPNKAFPHMFNYRTKQWNKIDISDRYYDAVAAGGINASVMDMGRYLKLLMGAYPDILSDYTRHILFNPIISTNSERNYYDYWKSVDASYYALGFRVHIYDSDTIIHHGGYVNGYRSELVILPTEKLAMCALFNASSNFASRCVPDFVDLYHLYNQPAIEPDSLMLP